MDIIFSYYRTLDDEDWQYRFHGTLDELCESDSSILLYVDSESLRDKIKRNGFYISVDDYTGSVQTIERVI